MVGAGKTAPTLCYNRIMDDAGQVIQKKAPAKKSVKPKDNEIDAATHIAAGGSVLCMTSDLGSWTTPSGVVFNSIKPYQFVPVEEIEALLASGRFRRAEPAEVKEFYNIEL